MRSAKNCRPHALAGWHLGRHLPIADPNSEGWGATSNVPESLHSGDTKYMLKLAHT